MDKILRDLGWQDIAPRYIHVPLASIDVSWVGEYYISIPRSTVWPDSTKDDKVYFHVFESFIDSFLDIFNINSTKKDESTTWAAYLNFMKKQHPDKIVKLYLDNSCGHCVAMLEENATPIPADLALELYQWLELEEHDVSNLSNKELSTEFVIMNKTLIQLFKGKHGVYRIGGMALIPHNKDGVKVYGILEHTSTKQLAIIKNKAVSLHVDTKNRQPSVSIKDVAELLSMIALSKQPPFRKLLIERLKTSRKTIASIQECLKISNMLMNKMGIPMRATVMELHKTLDYYGIVCPNVPYSKSRKFEAVRSIGNNIMIEDGSSRDKWLSTNPSHIDRLQLFHLLIDTIAKEEDLRKFREYVGGFLFSVGDLEDTNAQRLFSGFPKPKPKPRSQPKLQPPPVPAQPQEPIDIDDLLNGDDGDDTEDLIIDTDIISDFGTGTETATETDDMQSDYD